MVRLLCLLLLLCASPVMAADNAIVPEPASKIVPKLTPVVAKKFMAVAANPIAANIGRDILAKGGSAADAAIAIQLALGVVEPQSSGLGGGGFLMYYEAATSRMTSLDGREMAPLSAKPNQFLDDKGQPLEFGEAIKGGRSVGVPGVPMLMKTAHEKFGRLPWALLFEPAIALAEKGFPMSARLHDSLLAAPHLKEFASSYSIYTNEQGELLEVGDMVVNPALGKTLRTLAQEGVKPFYEGIIANAIVQAVNQSPINPGVLTLTDMQAYRVKERQPLCGTYRTYEVCSAAPPSSGGIVLLQSLGMLENFRVADMKPGSEKFVHILGEVTRRAYADRDMYAADADFVNVPVNKMLDPVYLGLRVKEIDPTKASVQVKPGEFDDTPPLVTAEADYERPSTTHFGAVDADGNMVSVTTSIEHGFGSGLSAEGVLLNNQLTDFAFTPDHNGVMVANSLKGGKRPRSSMTPVIVLDHNKKPLITIGSPGGARITAYVLSTLVAMLDWNMDIQKAIELPHSVNMNGTMELEKGTSLEQLSGTLEKMGHQVKVMDETSGLHGVSRLPDGTLNGGADPRREGVALGE